MPHEERTRSLPGLPPQETESRMQTGQADDISEAITVSEKHNDDKSDPVTAEDTPAEDSDNSAFETR